jgi:hypothetical protein
MNKHFLLVKKEQAPEDPRGNKVFIVDNPCCDLLFTNDMSHRIYQWNDEVLFNPEPRKDSDDFSLRLSDAVNGFIEDDKRNIIFMPFQPDIMRELGDITKKLYAEHRGIWCFLTFFYSDNDPQLLIQKSGGLPQLNLDQKVEWILAVGQFPFIHMVETKFGEIMTRPRLEELFQQYEP